jgi:2-dehydropantoate 2-reductase
MKITILGSGAIGGLAGSYMALQGEDVTFVDINKEHVDAIKTRGIVIDGGRSAYVPPQKACTPDELKEPLEAVFLAVKSQATREAVEEVKHLLTPDSFVVSLQNGLVNEEVIASVIGEKRTIGALPDYGGAYVDPGHLEFVIEGPVYVGELDGTITPRIKEIARLLNFVAPCEILTDIKSRIWAKRCFGSQTVASALVNQPYHVVLAEERAQRVCGPLVREALQVAYAYGIKVPDGPFFKPSLYFPKTHEDTLKLYSFITATVTRQAQYAIELEKAGKKMVKQGSGIHWDIVYRKRKSEVRWNHGPLEEKAAAVSVPAPLNTRLHRMIYQIEDHERQLGWHNFDELYDCILELGLQLPW